MAVVLVVPCEVNWRLRLVPCLLCVMYALHVVDSVCCSAFLCVVYVLDVSSLLGVLEAVPGTLVGALCDVCTCVGAFHMVLACGRVSMPYVFVCAVRCMYYVTYSCMNTC